MTGHSLPAISLARREDLRLGKVLVRPSRLIVDGPAGTAKGEPRVIQVLLALADARGNVVSRDDLLQLCWDGRIVGDDAINRAVAEVRRIVSSVGAAFEIETVPRIGYRIGGVEWVADAEAAPRPAPAVSRREVLAGGAAATVLLGGGAAALKYRHETELNALIDRGRILQGSGAPGGDKRAEALFRQALARDDGRADAWGWLAVVLDDNGKARDAALRAVAIDPGEANARTVLAYQRRDLDAWTDWEDALLGVLADAPGCAIALQNLTFFYQGMGRCRDSWSTNERVIDAEPFNPGPHARRALKHWIFGRIAEADRVADQSLQLWPRSPVVWNARMLIYAFTDRAKAALALLDDAGSRPLDLTAPSIGSWRAALRAIITRSSADIARMVAIYTAVAPLAPGLAANAIMTTSFIGETDAAYRFAEGLFESRGALVQRTRGGIKDVYAGSDWGRTQFLFVPAAARFRADSRFPAVCQRMGHIAYWRARGVWPDPFVRGALDPAKFV